MQELVAAKADVDKAKTDGWTPLRVANHFNHTSIVACLKSAGGEVPVASTNTLPPLPPPPNGHEGVYKQKGSKGEIESERQIGNKESRKNRSKARRAVTTRESIKEKTTDWRQQDSFLILFMLYERHNPRLTKNIPKFLKDFKNQEGRLQQTIVERVLPKYGLGEAELEDIAREILSKSEKAEQSSKKFRELVDAAAAPAVKDKGDRKHTK